MPKFVTKTIDGHPAVEGYTWDDIQTAAGKHRRSLITVESYSEEKEITLQQIRWFKGVLLPALSKNNGDSVAVWEARLKLIVMPDEFQSITAEIEGEIYTYLPSITKLSCKKTNQFIEGCVDKLRSKPFEYLWVFLPDSEKRSA